MAYQPDRKDLSKPRIVLITRKTSIQLLLERHGTLGQARFYLQSRGEDLRPIEELHQRFMDGFAAVYRALPFDQRRVQVDRDELDRFLFSPDDIVVIVGQDGLAPNAAKYLSGQLVIGVNPDPEHYDGVICSHSPADAPALLDWLEKRQGGAFRVESRIMALAEREDGQRLLALNEVFIGHRSHQSARYRIRAQKKDERQSSSGVICATGTGATGWVRSIAKQMKLKEKMPAPDEPLLSWFVREPWPSVSTGATLTHGLLKPGQKLELHSEMGEGGAVFADGIETDRLEFLNGHRISIRAADQTFNLVTGATAPAPPLPAPSADDR